MKAQKAIPEERCRVIFLGHASALISMNGLNIITDPNFSRHIFFVIWRKSRIPMKVRDLPPVDLILLSHGHYDHLDISSLRKLPKDAPVITPPGLNTVLRLGARKQIIELRPETSHNFKDISITAVPANHFLGRPPFFPMSQFQGYVIEGDATVYFAGDTGIFDGMSEIGMRWDIDIALLPIGAYSPPSFRKHHMSPEDAIEAGRMLRAKAIVPIHWGAFKLSLEPMSEPAPRLKRVATKSDIASKVMILEPGESVSIRGSGNSETIESA